MSKLLVINWHLFLKLYLPRIHSAMATGKDLILLHHDELSFYTALIEYI